MEYENISLVETGPNEKWGAKRWKARDVSSRDNATETNGFIYSNETFKLMRVLRLRFSQVTFLQ